MNEDEKKTAINILAAHIRETLLVRDRESGEMRAISIADYRPCEMVVSRAFISDPLCLALEEAGARIVYNR